MIKQWVPVVAIGVILSACASVPPAQTVATEKPFSATKFQTSETSDPGTPQATVTRVMWFFAER